MAKTQRQSQEFYCGECRGYFIVRLNMALNHEALIKCPNCGHEHQRCVNNGVIYERGRFANSVKETVRPMKSSYSKKPRTKAMEEAHEKNSYRDRRDGVKMSRQQLSRWAEIADRESTGVMFDD